MLQRVQTLGPIVSQLIQLAKLHLVQFPLDKYEPYGQLRQVKELEQLGQKEGQGIQNPFSLG